MINIFDFIASGDNLVLLMVNRGMRKIFVE